ncbi:MAG: hypothetical protein KDC46_12145, partial [Thermoleophilia bacterium]|nr:hypothetical protein [Thermoleophilia bacterium]
ATRAKTGTAVQSTSGAASCPNGNKCYVSGKTVSFNSTYTAFNRIAKADPSGTCASPFRMCRVLYSNIFPAAANGTMPMFYVDVSQTCVRYRRARFPLRQDSLSYPLVDDSQAPTFYGGYSTKCPETGGGAMMFEGDVILTGTRPLNSPPVTVMARRPQNIASQTVRLPGSGNVAQISESASIYLLPSPGGGSSGTIGGSGSGPSQSALGVVAEGGVYIPTVYANGNLTIRKASLIAAGSGFSLGPSFQQVAGDTGVVDQSGTEISAGGIDPCSPSAGLPVGGSFVFAGTFASRQVPFLNYVRGSCAKGYTNRTYQFDTELGWNPPPFFPAPSSWHLVDSRVFNT